MVAYRRQLVLLRADHASVAGLDLPRRVALFRETAGDDDGFAVLFGFEGFFTLVFEGDGYFCDTERERERILVVLKTTVGGWAVGRRTIGLL
jgi:hypothetical protein